MPETDKPFSKSVSTSWQEALTVIASALNQTANENQGYSYALIGSGAYVLNGVQFNDPNDAPADIDITSTHLGFTRDAILALEDSGAAVVTEEPSSSFTTNKFVITLRNGESVKLELTEAEDFGYNQIAITIKNNVAVTGLKDTLLSIFLRPEQRNKELLAFSQLIKNNLEEVNELIHSNKHLNPSFKNALQEMAQLFSNPSKANNEQLVMQTLARLLPRGKLQTEINLKAQHQRTPQISNSNQTLFGASANSAQERQKRRLERLQQAEEKFKTKPS